MSERRLAPRRADIPTRAGDVAVEIHAASGADIAPRAGGGHRRGEERRQRCGERAPRPALADDPGHFALHVVRAEFCSRHARRGCAASRPTSRPRRVGADISDRRRSRCVGLCRRSRDGPARRSSPTVYSVTSWREMEVFPPRESSTARWRDARALHPSGILAASWTLLLARMQEAARHRRRLRATSGQVQRPRGTAARFRRSRPAQPSIATGSSSEWAKAAWASSMRPTTRAWTGASR